MSDDYHDEPFGCYLLQSNCLPLLEAWTPWALTASTYEYSDIHLYIILCLSERSREPTEWVYSKAKSSKI